RPPGEDSRAIRGYLAKGVEWADIDAVLPDGSARLRIDGSHDCVAVVRERCRRDVGETSSLPYGKYEPSGRHDRIVEAVVPCQFVTVVPFQVRGLGRHH